MNGFFIPSAEENSFMTRIANMVVEKIKDASENPQVTGRPFTIDQVMEYLQISRPTVMALFESGALKYYQIGQHYRVRYTDLLEYEAKNAK